MRKTEASRYRYTLKGRMKQHSVEFAIVLLLIFVLYRIFLPQVEGEKIAVRERRVIRLLREIHTTQVEVAAEGGERLLWLDELERRSKPGSLLRKALTESAPEAPDVDLISLGGYYLALNLSDPGRDDDRAWSRRLAVSDEVGTAGYAAFGWPKVYGPTHQWVFYIDQRGKLMGSWNHEAEFDGLKQPFPPKAHPLRDFLTSKKEDKDAEWFQFRSMAEVQLAKHRPENQPENQSENQEDE